MNNNNNNWDDDDEGDRGATTTVTQTVNAFMQALGATRRAGDFQNEEDFINFIVELIIKAPERRIINFL